jgi:hypothetical protein
LERFVDPGMLRVREIPQQLLRVNRRYAGHFDVAMKDLHESDDLRVLDFNGRFACFTFRNWVPRSCSGAASDAEPASATAMG